MARGRTRRSEKTTRGPGQYERGLGRVGTNYRLESRDTDRMFWPVDKQVGLLSFDVLQSRSDFIGAVDFGPEISPQTTAGSAARCAS